MSEAAPPICPYCGQPAKLLASSARHYGGREFGKLWRCDPCDAHVGCHKGTDRPLGGLANWRLRRMKMAAHAEFDPLWRAKMRRDGCTEKVARSAAYRWLAQQMGLTMKQTHIGMFDEAQCEQVVALCLRVRSGKAAEARLPVITTEVKATT